MVEERVMSTKPITKIRLRNKETGEVKISTADPEGFFNVTGGPLACGRCGGMVPREFSARHFDVCRRLMRLLPEPSRIIVPEDGV